MNIHEVVTKLVGPINPVGEAHTDEKRYENLKVAIDLTAQMISEIRDVAMDNKDRHEHSMRKAGKLAAEFIASLKEPDDE